jgi:uncharacterized protein
LSTKPEKDSHHVSPYLQKYGDRVIPANPFADKVLGEKSYPSLIAVPAEIQISSVFGFQTYLPEPL